METLQQQLAYAKTRRRGLMRRVWYIFFLSFVTKPAFALGLAFGASAIAFWQLVSVSSIIANFLSTEVGHLPTYIWTSLVQADTAALLAFVVLAYVGLRLALSFWAIKDLVVIETWRPV
ncbi:MAG: hypothetical protein RLZZ70_633 [Candidatus Parcubacteria bacterium]|jgi:hypothetical protein